MIDVRILPLPPAPIAYFYNTAPFPPAMEATRGEDRSGDVGGPSWRTEGKPEPAGLKSHSILSSSSHPQTSNLPPYCSGFRGFRGSGS